MKRSGSAGWKVVAMAAALAAAGALGACGSGAAQKPAAVAAPPVPAARPATHAPAPAGAAKLQPVSIEVPARASAFTYLYAARDLGVFAHLGLAPKIMVMKPPAAIPAILNGELDFMSATGSAAHATERGQPLRIVEIAANHIGFGLLGAKGITSISQLRGKAISAGSPISAATVLTVALLRQDGLPPGSYTLLKVSGGDPVRLALVTSGKAAATMLDLATAIPLQKQGYSIIGYATHFTMPFSGLATSLQLMKTDPSLVRRTIAAVVQGTRLARTDKQQVVPIMVREFHLQSTVASQLFDLLAGTWSRGGRPAKGAITNQFKEDVRQMHLSQTPTPSRIFDFSLLPAPAGAAS